METFFDAKKPSQDKTGSGWRKAKKRISFAVTLGIELTAIISVEYADGRRSQELVFSVEVDLDGKREIVPAALTAGAEALIGTALLAKYELRINFPLQRIKLQKT